MVGYRALAGVALAVSVVAVMVFVFVGAGGVNLIWWGVVLGVLGVALGLYGLMGLLIALEDNTHRSVEVMNRVSRHLDDMADELEKIRDNILLSDAAKSIAFRDNDRDALFQAIEEEMNQGDWEGALSLADQMSERFGYHEQAEQLRQRVRDSRERERQQSLSVAVARINDLFVAHDWDAASREIDALVARYPDEVEVSSLPERLERARNEHKKWLLQQCDEAVQRSEVDRAIEILKELDKYLTPNEVAALEESARGVFRDKLHNLGTQFSMLVTEKLWDQALEVAREIIKEFPNSRMAQEIRDRMDALQAKAAARREGAAE